MSERSLLESLVPSRISTTSATSSSAELELEKENAAVPVFERRVGLWRRVGLLSRVGLWRRVGLWENARVMFHERVTRSNSCVRTHALEQNVHP